MSTPLEQLRAVADALEDLVEQVVFVGGATLGLLVTDPGAATPGATDDVDAIARTLTRSEYEAFCSRLRALGFKEDMDGPVCRWRVRGLKVDLMPPIEAILGFTNRWYAEALENPEIYNLGGVKVHVVSAPYAVGTKLDAFDGRGGNDFAASRDLEDFIAIVDGRQALLAELAGAAPNLRRHVALRTARLLADARFLDAVPGHLPGDAAGQARIGLVLSRLRALAALR